MDSQNPPLEARAAEYQRKVSDAAMVVAIKSQALNQRLAGSAQVN